MHIYSTILQSEKVIKEDRAISLINLFGIQLTDNLFRLSSPPQQDITSVVITSYYITLSHGRHESAESTKRFLARLMISRLG